MRGAASGLAFAFLLLGCEPESTMPSAEPGTGALAADQVSYGLRHNQTKEGIRRAVMEGDSAYIFEGERRWDLFGVRVSFYDDTGREVGTLTSKTGDYNLGSGLFIARGDVVLVSQGPEGERQLETEELNYSVRDDHLWSNVPFTVTENGEVSRGNTFESDTKFQRWTVTGGQTQGDPGEGGLSF